MILGYKYIQKSQPNFKKGRQLTFVKQTNKQTAPYVLRYK